jgi:hypothetical protein
MLNECQCLIHLEVRGSNLVLVVRVFIDSSAMPVSAPSAI